MELVKKRLQVTIREDLVEWMDKEVLELRFASKSHAIEFALMQLVKNEKNLTEIIPGETIK
jgi:Arc/MetJ-type ribon-helix-helix transcriptional regulator